MVLLDNTTAYTAGYEFFVGGLLTLYLIFSPAKLEEKGNRKSVIV